MCDNSCYFEPTFTLNGILILEHRCQAFIAQRKAEVLPAVAHLALLGVKIQEPAFWVTNEKQSFGGLFFIMREISKLLFFKER